MEEFPRPTLLVFGGSAFMGKTLVSTCVDNVVTVCRGNVYWGKEYCGERANRNDAEEFSKKIGEILPRIHLIGVVDFCGFLKKHIECLPDILFDTLDANKAPYVFISTDSVYECTDMATVGAEVLESAKISKKFKHRDKYGYNKYRCEKLLSRRATNLIVLRLPDVLGEFDDTFRFAKMIQQANAPEMDPTPLAFVYSGDVVAFILHIIKCPFSMTLNLSMDEQLSAIEFSKLVYATCKKDVANKIGIPYPSVEYRRVPLSNALAKRYGFVPSRLEDVIKRVVKWTLEAQILFPKEFSRRDACISCR